MSDVTIRGAGIFGLSIAWACACRGAQVTVIDPHGIGQGASNGLVGALAPHVPENWNDKKAIQFDSLLKSQDFWAEVAQTAGVDPSYARLGRVQPLADANAVALARQRELTARTLWQGRFSWRVMPVAEAGVPVHSATGLIVKDTLSARIHPRRATAALASALEARGAEITSDAPVRGAEIHATGVAGLEALNGMAGERIVGSAVKGQAALLDADLRDAPQVFGDGLHIVPHGDGTTAVGSTSENTFHTPTGTDALLDEVIERARALCPALAGAAVLERWAGLRPLARSRAPMLGAHPLFPGAFIANGGFKIGFGMAPVIAELMADLVLEGRDRIPQMFKPEASLR